MGQNFTKVDPITVVFFKTHTHEGNLAVQCLRHPVKNELITNNFWYYVFFSGTQSKGNNFGIKKHTHKTHSHKWSQPKFRLFYLYIHAFIISWLKNTFKGTTLKETLKYNHTIYLYKLLFASLQFSGLYAENQINV